jgi:hypothetical protein
MENFSAKNLERSESKRETEIPQLWVDIKKKAAEFREPTAEEKIRDRWNNLRLAASENRKYAAKSEFDADEAESDTSEADEQRAEQQETPKELVDECIDDLKANSEYPETIEDDGTPWERLSPEEIAEKRAEFNANKEKLIKVWEEKNGKEWPRYKEDVYVNGKLIRKAGDRYDAHHIKPLSFGGKNEAGNITPISAEKHFDKQGIHSPTGSYGKIEKSTQGVKTA